MDVLPPLTTSEGTGTQIQAGRASTLAVWCEAVWWLTAAIALGSGTIAAYALHSTIDRHLAGSAYFIEVVEAEDRFNTVMLCAVAVSLVAIVLAMVWGYRARRELGRAGAVSGLTAGWAVGAWFVPLAQLVLVPVFYRQVARMSRVPAPIGDRWRQVSGLWWPFGLPAGIVLWRIGIAAANERLVGPDPTEDALRSYGLLVGVSAGLLACGYAAMALGIRSARRPAFAAQTSAPTSPPRVAYRVGALLVVPGVAAASFIVGARLSAAGLVEPVSGEVVTASELEAARRSAALEAEMEATISAQAELGDAVDDAYREGLEDGREEGEREGYDVGYRDGAARGYALGRMEGCQEVFDALSTDRIMDFWTFYNGANWAEYIDTGFC